jgi:hypothetical protein
MTFKKRIIDLQEIPDLLFEGPFACEQTLRYLNMGNIYPNSTNEKEILIQMFKSKKFLNLETLDLSGRYNTELLEPAFASCPSILMQKPMKVS